MGINDLGRKVDISVFAADYEYTLTTIKDKHPNAFVLCQPPRQRYHYEKTNRVIQHCYQ